jgi:porin
MAADPAGSADARPQGRQPWLEWTWATGDWSKTRERLERRGVSLAFSITSDFSRMRSTSAGERNVGRALIDTRVMLDLAALGGWRGLNASAQYYAKVGDDGSTWAGNAQGFSNIDAESFRRIAELWIEQSMANGRLRVKVGRVDANAEFAAVDAGADFLNPSMGYSPTILLFPTYPDPRLGVNVALEISRHFELGLGAYRGTDAELPASGDAAHSRFTVAELRVSGSAETPARLRVGLWHHIGPIEPLDGSGLEQIAAHSPYVTFEKTLRRQRERAEDDQARDVSMFVQYGVANARVSEITRHVGAGIAWHGPVARRPLDVLGLGATIARLSPFMSEAHGGEILVAAFYKYRVAPWLSLQPDLQYVAHPAGGARRASIFFTCRLRVDL